MAYIDDRIWCHPKWVGLSPLAFRVGVSSICYSHGFITRGRLTVAQQRQIGATDRARRELVEHGIWEQNGTTILIHDWADYNDDSARETARSKTRERVRRYRKRRAGNAEHDALPTVTGDVTDDVTGDVTDGVTSRARAIDSESESEVSPLTPAERGNVTADHVNPRAAGTNPRAVAEREQAAADAERRERHDKLVEHLTIAVPQWAPMDSMTFDDLLDGIEVERRAKLSASERDQLWDIALQTQRGGPL
jgi:hypothetical protein